MPVIQSVTARAILDSHVQFTSEYVLRCAGGVTGSGASSRGETIGIYEDGRRSDSPMQAAEALARDGMLETPLDQEAFDSYLGEHIGELGRGACCALSLAFLQAAEAAGEATPPQPPLTPPRLCLNVLNGGRHAYTNPVLSDFPEYLLVARSRDIGEVVARHSEIQEAVRRGLSSLPLQDVSGNRVHRFSAADNRACLEFLLGVLDELACAAEFDIMIDASAGDLWDGDAYRLSVTDDSRHTSDDFLRYWLELVRDYGLGLLEDPFREEDPEAWTRLTAAQDTCAVIGDNFYCSDAARITAGAAARRTTGVIIKPDQAGTVTAVRRAVEAARSAGQTVITSHRSISTESTYVAALSCEAGADAIKVGPLLTDYSSVLRLNEIIRLSGDPR